MTDNDGGGKLARERMTEAFHDSMVKIKHVKLPREKDAKGKLIKLDPDNAPYYLIKEVRSRLKEQHGKKCFFPAKRLGWARENKPK